MKVIETANHAIARAAKLARVEVVSAYPITPQTQVIEEIARLIEVGEMDSEYIPVESEHSAMAALIGVGAAGVRGFSATSSHGLAYMHELLHWAAAVRLPLVMVNVNRAMGPGWNIWCDHQDTIAARDTGWIQLYCASHQEAVDTLFHAYRIAEDHRVIMPVMVNYDAFLLSHTYMKVVFPEQEQVDRFLPPLDPYWKLDLDNPMTHGSVIYPDDYEEVRFSMQQGHENARKVIGEAADEYSEIVGNYHGALVDGFQLDDAEHVILAMGSIAAEAKMAVRKLRERGTAAGLLRVRSYRPFPNAEVRGALEGKSTLVVIDRDCSFGNEGALFADVKAAAYGFSEARAYNLICGLGGRDITYNLLADCVQAAVDGKSESLRWPALKLNEHHLASRRGVDAARARRVAGKDVAK
ncbi:MAG: pyruvate ferredoxin oxidoreductase [Candidatus Geothermincolia bacterium]